MDEKISLKSVDQYAQQFANHLVTSFFAKKSKIMGAEILQLSTIKQVNLFVVRDLLITWKKESEKLKSPYFDYEASEVTDALKHYHNALSNHILIGKQDFLPLLTRAVNQTIYLILDPYDFYSDTLDKREGGVGDAEQVRIERPSRVEDCAHDNSCRLAPLPGEGQVRQRRGFGFVSYKKLNEKLIVLFCIYFI